MSCAVVEDVVPPADVRNGYLLFGAGGMFGTTITSSATKGKWVEPAFQIAEFAPVAADVLDTDLVEGQIGSAEAVVVFVCRLFSFTSDLF